MKRRLFQEMSYSLISNIISMIVGMLAILIIPKFIGVDKFGYYQLYLFYTGYVTISALGLADGNYLHIGGNNYYELDMQKQCSQFWALTTTQTILYVLLAVVVKRSFEGEEGYVYLLVCLCAIIIHARYYLYLTLQATERIKEYAIIIITERLLSVLISIIIVLCGYRDFQLLVALDVFGRTVSLFIAVFYCKEFVFLRPLINLETLSIAKQNIQAGAMVLFSTLSSAIIIGISRFAVQQHWGIETFSKISLTVSISNMATRCINAVGIVMFPVLRKMDYRRLPEVYKRINAMLMPAIFLLFVLYQPMAFALSKWLPRYSDSLKYAAILLPVCAYECKNVMLTSTYLKTLFKEKILLLSNAISIAVSFIGTVISVLIFDSVEMTMISILFSLIIRCVFAEIYIGKTLNFSVRQNIVYESIMVFSFVLCNWYLGKGGFFVYIGILSMYILANIKDIKSGLIVITDHSHTE